MMNRWLIALVVQFIMRQLEKFGHSIDWAKVKADLKTRVEALIPGTWFDAEAVAAVNAIVDAAAKAMASTHDIQMILDLIAAQKWPEAFDALKALLLKVWAPKAGGKEADLAAELAILDTTT